MPGGLRWRDHAPGPGPAGALTCRPGRRRVVRLARAQRPLTAVWGVPGPHRVKPPQTPCATSVAETDRAHPIWVFYLFSNSIVSGDIKVYLVLQTSRTKICRVDFGVVILPLLPRVCWAQSGEPGEARAILQPEAVGRSVPGHGHTVRGAGKTTQLQSCI